MVTKGSFSVWDESLSSVDAKYTPPPIKLVERARLQSGKSGGQLCMDQVPLLSPSDEIDEHEIGPGATWWTPSNVVQDPHTRRLMGEIHLPRGLQPSCHFPLFNILVSIFDLAWFDQCSKLQHSISSSCWHPFGTHSSQNRYKGGLQLEGEKGVSKCFCLSLSKLPAIRGTMSLLLSRSPVGRIDWFQRETLNSRSTPVE
jgi:hypothetical protein